MPSSTQSSAQTSAEPPAAANPLPALNVAVEQVLDVPVTGIALGDGTRIAVLADPPRVGDRRGLHPLPLPSGLRAKPGENERLGIYFGRDNEPRIMGQRQTSAGEAAIYFRHLPNGWRDGREEIGQLGGTTRGALWGVLGGADPELVCRTGAVCIIKRQSGWTTVPRGPQPAHRQPSGWDTVGARCQWDRGHRAAGLGARDPSPGLDRAARFLGNRGGGVGERPA